MHLETEFAAPEKDSFETISAVHELLSSETILTELLFSSNDPCMILNEKRQLILSNNAFKNFVNIGNDIAILGKRPGEIFNCIHSKKVSGCGTTAFCVNCGAIKAIVASYAEMSEESKSCVIKTIEGSIVHVLVSSKPFTYLNKKFTFLTLKENSVQKRKKALESTFLHDILNRVYSIYSLAEIINDLDKDENPEYYTKGVINHCTDLVEEINGFTSIVRAEDGELNIRKEKIHLKNLLLDIKRLAEGTAKKYYVNLQLSECSDKIIIYTDIMLLKKILMNMVKNAVEASFEGQTVSIFAQAEEDRILINTHNETVIAKENINKIFVPFFTTKPYGTGLGTYSIKLLSESYLDASVSFITSEDKGTIFTISIPKFKDI